MKNPHPVPGFSGLSGLPWLAGLLAAAIVCSCAAQRTPEFQKRTYFVMDTYCTITLPGGAEMLPLLDEAGKILERVYRELDTIGPGGPVYRFNHEGTALRNPDIAEVVRTGLEVYRLSGGAFDLTVGPLLDLWGFSTGEYRKPSEAEILQALRHCGSDLLRFDGVSLSKSDPAVRVDFGGVGQGFAVKKVIGFFRSKGVRSCLIDLSGDIYCLGGFGGRPWRVGIKDPRGEGLLGVVALSNKALVTSGDYERFFVENGTRYHHILNPRTGYPAWGCESVTVICDDPLRADAWSTALFSLGPEKAVRTASSLKGIEVIVVATNGRLTVSPGLSGAFTASRKEKK